MGDVKEPRTKSTEKVFKDSKAGRCQIAVASDRLQSEGSRAGVRRLDAGAAATSSRELWSWVVPQSCSASPRGQAFTPL